MRRKSIILFILVLMMTKVFAVNTDDSTLSVIIAKGRAELKLLQEQNQRNDEAGLSERNQYILNIHTVDEGGPVKVESLDKEFIKQRKLTYEAGSPAVAGDFFITDVSALNKLNEKLRVLNSKKENAIKTYLLMVDFVPMAFDNGISADITLKELLSENSEDVRNKAVAALALQDARQIVEGITEPFIKQQQDKVLFCGLMKFKVFVESYKLRDIYLYYPHNNVDDVVNGAYQTILKNYISSIAFKNGPQYVEDFIVAMEGNNKDYQNLPNVKEKIMQTTTSSEMYALLKTISNKAYDALTGDERLHAIKVLAGVEIFTEAQTLINELLESTQPDDANTLLAAMEQLNDKAPAIVKIYPGNVGVGSGGPPTDGPNRKKDWCLLRGITEETKDMKFGPWGEDNYKRLIKAFIAICKMSSDFNDQVKVLQDANSDKIVDRTIFYTYNSIWSKIEATLVNISPMMPPMVQKIDRNTSYIDNCELKTETQLFFSYMGPDDDQGGITLKPFEPIVFVNNSDLGMLADLNSGEKMFVTPAILLKYVDEKAFNQTAADATMAAVDVISLATGYGEIKAGVTGIRKAWVLFDMFNSGMNLSLNVTGATQNEKVRDILNAYNLITGGISITRMAAGGIKNVYTYIRGKKVLNGDDIAQLFKAIENGGEELKMIPKADVENIELLVKRVRDEAKARGLTKLEKDADNLLARMGSVAEDGQLLLARMKALKYGELEKKIANLSTASREKFLQEFDAISDKGLEILNKNPKLIDNWELNGDFYKQPYPGTGHKPWDASVESIKAEADPDNLHLLSAVESKGPVAPSQKALAGAFCPKLTKEKGFVSLKYNNPDFDVATLEPELRTHLDYLNFIRDDAEAGGKIFEKLYTNIKKTKLLAADKAGIHAEVQAVNEIIKKMKAEGLFNSLEDLKDIRVLVRGPKMKNLGTNTNMIRCPHCYRILLGVNMVGNL
ncbi:hypothetical protein [Chitinophaga sp. CF418]|uniref:hypothetical protein n=1 Tax=Chitinophaga sp. CF418 TaxID=1855287 RepID=UPI000918180D|nr:hypothetical protein [Chitinophaga sp. CF418]SHM83372.1 hypothetical protein SAMN05216311_103398 [Chitinophaga sp. CF418]